MSNVKVAQDCGAAPQAGQRETARPRNYRLEDKMGKYAQPTVQQLRDMWGTKRYIRTLRFLFTCSLKPPFSEDDLLALMEEEPDAFNLLVARLHDETRNALAKK